MAFWGSEFIFDGVPCSQFGLMVYHFGSNSQEDVAFPDGSIIEDRLPSRFDALTYGLVQNQPLEYTLVFGANMASIDANESIDRYEVEAISAWLTGHRKRKWLAIVQDDMESYRYKCYITNLKLITHGDYPWAFSCKVSCDSSFAYTFPEVFEYDVNGTKTVNFFNRSTYNGFYRPEMEIQTRGGTGSFIIQNETDNGRVFQFSGLPAGNQTIYVDNKNQIIKGSTNADLYEHFNMKFLRLLRGDNILRITGNAHLKIVCEFPVNVGG